MNMDVSEVTYTISCEPEDMQIEGNCMASGDPKVDAEAAAWVRAELNAGNDWAWCVITVVARYSFEGVEFVGMDCLGGCSYKSEADFREPGGYFDDMKAGALQDLRDRLQAAIVKGVVAGNAAKALASKG